MIKINLVRAEVEKKTQLALMIDDFLERLPPGVREYAHFYKHPIFIKVVACIILLNVLGVVIEIASTKGLANVEAQKKEVQQKITKEKQVEQQLKDDSQEVAVLEKLRAEKEEIKRKLLVLKTVANVRFKIFRVMDRISGSIPNKVWITDMSIKGKVISMKGSSWEFKPISLFEADLKSSEYFSNVHLHAITTSSSNLGIDNLSIPGNLELLKNFEITAELREEVDLKESAFQNHIPSAPTHEFLVSSNRKPLLVEEESAKKRIGP